MLDLLAFFTAGVGIENSVKLPAVVTRPILLASVSVNPTTVVGGTTTTGAQP